MKVELIKRLKFWDTSFPNYTEDQIVEFELVRDISIPDEYRNLLKTYGKLKFIKTWFIYYDLQSEGEHLINDTFSLAELKLIWENYWEEITRSNINLQTNKYLPIIGTYSPNFLFLIGLTNEQRDKIFGYDTDYEDFMPVEVAESIEDFFLNKIYSLYDVNSNSKIGTIDIFKQSGIESWDIGKAIIECQGTKINIQVETNGTLINSTINTRDDLFPSFKAQLNNEISDDFINPTEFKSDNIITAKIDYFETEEPKNLKIGIVKGYKEVYYYRIEGEIENAYEWESENIKFKISFKKEKSQLITSRDHDHAS
jgi:hypothetical protein